MIEQEELAKEVAAMFQVLQDGIREAFEGMTYGTKEADTPTFVKWFELKVQEPYWIDAMATFPEGRRMIKRYNEAKAKEWDDGTTVGR